jgi:hypothetical protein
MKNITREQIESYIPLDKSWLITLGILDLVNDRAQNIISFLDSQDPATLGKDLQSLRGIAKAWPERYTKALDPGESGRLYRTVKWYYWQNNIPLELPTSDTLTKRREKITNNPEILNWTPEQLLTLDSKTTQWATTQYIFSPREQRRRIEPRFNYGRHTKRSADFKLRVGYDAVEHYDAQEQKGENWIARIDPTLFNQYVAFIDKLKKGKMCYTGEQAEDYCFERAFDLVDEAEGRLIYPSVEGHETDRFKEMETMLSKFEQTGVIESQDHRVVQAGIMRAIAQNRQYVIANPQALNKTQPKFLEFIDFVKDMKKA